MYSCKTGDESDTNEVVQEEQPILDLGVYPNPSTDFVNIGIQSDQSQKKEVKFMIYTSDLRSAGEVVVQVGSEPSIINVSSFSAGRYYLIPEDQELRNQFKASFIVIK